MAFTLVFYSKNILSVWDANQGSVLMSQVELDGFPNNGWAGPAIVSNLSDSEIALRSSLQFAPNNRTANQRLGMISMLRQNFESASEYLETAYKVTPDHRGIVKSLGYCYVWLGDLEKAELFLSRIPEAQEELDVYIWWWDTQGRGDLSENAALALQTLQNPSKQP
jgi:lipopolysaccharide biosynthesis regulator YciM